MRVKAQVSEAGAIRRSRRRSRKWRAAKRMAVRILPWALIAAGLAVTAFAVISRLSVSSEQEHLVAQYRSAGQRPVVSEQDAASPSPFTELPDPDAVQPDQSEDADPATLAVLSVPAIDLEVAMREGVGSYSLRYSVGHYPKSVMPGETGNCVILGHRNYTYGEFFNRLDELTVGDEITLERAGTVYTYLVTETFVVEPGDTYVLDPTDDATVTLITCTPIRVATHRLIVRAALKSALTAG